MAKKNKDKKSANPSIADKIIDLTDFEEPISTVIWGRSGHGKTTTAATWPKPILFIDVNDKGCESAKSLKLKKGDIKVISIKTADELEEIMEYIHDNSDTYKTVVIDHMTQVQEIYKQKILDEEGRTKMSQPMFGTLSGYMKSFIMDFRSLEEDGIYPVYIAQDRTDEIEGSDDDVLDPDVGPAMTPAVQKFLIASVKVVGRQYIASYEEKVKIDGKPKKVQKTEYRMWIGPSPYYATKIRKPRGSYCPDYLVNPTFDDILAITRGEYKDLGKADKDKKKKKKK